MQLNKLLYQLLVITIVVGLYAFSAAGQTQTEESVEAGGNKVLIKVSGVTDVNNSLVTVGGNETKIISGSSQANLDGSSSFDAEMSIGIASGRASIDVKYDNKAIGSQSVNIPHQLYERGEPPVLIELKPLGGREGDTITIVGKNFGKDQNNITIRLEKLEIKDGNETFTKIQDVRPSYVYTPDAQNQQELEFSIPTDKDLGLVGVHWLYNNARLRVIVNGQESKYSKLRFVHTNWRMWAALIAFILVVIVFLPLFRMAVMNWDFLKTLFIDKKTNTYSLSKCQAFAWTIVLIYSYFYLAIGTGLILGKWAIPDFNPSLLGLMGISYGGMLIARGSSARIPKNDLTETPRQLSDLISEGGEISLPRLQLVGFTITAIFIYLYYLTSADLFVNGLPDIPPTLLGLLGISQGGYIGGKVAGGRLAVNYVVPRRAQLGRENVKLTIIGSGFITNSKVLFQDHPKLIDTEFLNSNSLSVDLPKLSQAGLKQLVLVPPTGSGVVIDGVIEVVDAKIEKVERVPNNPRQVKLTLKGFNLQEIQATIANKPATTSIDETNNLLTLKAEADIKTDDDIKITSADEQLGDETKVP